MDDSAAQVDEWMPTIYVGQHESKRALPVTEQALRQAQDFHYDMLTTPITNDHFHSRVLALLSNATVQATAVDTELPESGKAVSSNVDDAFIHFRLSSHLNPSPPPEIPALTLVDTPLSPGNIISGLLAIASPWIDLSSPDPLVYDFSRQVLEMEIAYAAFCGIENVIVPGPKLHYDNLRADGVTRYARAIREALNGNHLQVHLSIPMIDHADNETKNEMGSLASLTREEYLEELTEDWPRKTDVFGTWDAWHAVRTLCKYSSRLFVDLFIPKNLPIFSIQSRWLSEPVRILSMKPTSFGMNPSGYPAFSKAIQAFIAKFMRLKTPPWILLCDVGPIPGIDNPEMVFAGADGYLSPNATADASVEPTPSEAAKQDRRRSKKTEDPTPHLSYIRHLQRHQPPRSPIEQYGAGYQDYLQAPLQPLADNLESMTYEVFEKDPVKYDQYEKALKQALRDWSDEQKPSSSPDGRVVVAVVGAGRGPLVTRALRASEAEGVEIELWAVEKNPNAFVLLQKHNVEEWQNSVNVIKSDMRSWKGPSHFQSTQFSSAVSHPDDQITAPPDLSSSLDHSQSTNASALPSEDHHRIDIIVSELLGSFADNELSPECLDGILHLLNPTHGLSIPHSYTSFLTPISAPKLHADISARLSWDSSAAETPSVVWLHAIDFLSIAPTAVSSSSQPAKAPQLAASHPLTNTKATATTPSSTSTSTLPSLPSLTPPTIMPTWTFTHTPQPRTPSLNTHNRRHTRLRFRIRDRAVCHGLAGYFECTLYKSVKLSTNPLSMPSYSPDMISWFPIFFPLRNPLYVPDHSEISVEMWRATDERKVWYEWAVEGWGWCLGIGGERERRRVRLGGGEMMSSVGVGCLM